MKIRIVSSTEYGPFPNPRRGEYYTYLDNHISGVKDSWYRFLRPALVDKKYDIYDITDAEIAIEKHDASKYDDEEFVAYCNYFYPDPSHGFSKSSKDFDAAWLIHLHKNPHHWQHWVLLRDSGEVEPQDMPFPYICEMLCDWHSFSSKDPENTAYKWYKAEGSKMKLSDKTRKEVEKLIEYLQDPLMEVEDEETTVV